MLPLDAFTGQPVSLASAKKPVASTAGHDPKTGLEQGKKGALACSVAASPKREGKVHGGEPMALGARALSRRAPFIYSADSPPLLFASAAGSGVSQMPSGLTVKGSSATPPSITAPGDPRNTSPESAAVSSRGA